MLTPFLTSVGQILEFVDNHWFLFCIAKLENRQLWLFQRKKTENRTTGVFQKPQSPTGFKKKKSE
jgi:hypothetical protein